VGSATYGKMSLMNFENSTLLGGLMEGFSKTLPKLTNMKKTEIEQVCKDYGIYSENQTVTQLKNIWKEFREEQEKENREHIEKRIQKRKEERDNPLRPPFIPAKDSHTQQEFTKLIHKMNEFPEVMQKCHLELHKINKMFPSRKNENKMVFGKLAERSLSCAYNKMGIQCIDLDKLCEVGSEYKNDFKIGDIKISQKTTKNKTGDIILINTFSTLDHDLNIDLLLCVIETGKIYFIPHDVVDELEYVDYKPGRIVYKNSIKKYIENNYPQFVYSFPPLSEKQSEEINETVDVDLIARLYEMI